MDEQRLGQVFRDAVQALPPASFNHDEVVAASRRATARRRSALAGGTLLGVAVLAGGLVATDLLTGDPGPPAAETAALAPGGRQGDTGTLSTLDTARCGPVDLRLGNDLTALLTNQGRAVSGPPGEVPEPCPAGSRAAAVPVAGGTLYVLLIPQPAQPTRPDGTRTHSVPLPDGRTLTVISVPGAPGQPAPLADDLPDLARELAAAL
ncbi:MAG: hypothetical protein ACRDSR_13515 [Pseudonocardiaceae bacterium]